MAEPADPAAGDVPQAVVVPRHRRPPQLVWIVPALAALIGIWLIVASILRHGPSADISFRNADGIEAGKTHVRYKDVDIGTVRHIAIAKDRRSVIVTAEFTREAKDYLVEDTRFWVVHPRVSAAGISGLGTLISGSFIEADVGTSDQSRREFKGLENPPIVTSDVPGRAFILHAQDLGSLDVGAPVFYRRIQVGQIVAYDLDPGGGGITLRVFVNAPYDAYVTTNTRFWHASGFDVTLDSAGLRVTTQSLASIVAGGIAFGEPPHMEASPAAKADAEFKLARDRVLAMRDPDTEVHSYVMYFHESLRGLAPGAPVDISGVEMGEVRDIGIEYLPATHSYRFPVHVDIYPGRIKARTVNPDEVHGDSPAEVHTMVDGLVGSGLRAQLRSGNLLTGQLYVAMDFFPKAPAFRIDWSHNPPELPTMPGSFGELQNTLADIAQKIDKVPFEDLSHDLRQSLKSLNQTLSSTDSLVRNLDRNVAPEVTRTLGDARRALADAEAALAEDSPVRNDVHDTLSKLMRAADSLRALTDSLERHPESLIRGKTADADRLRPNDRQVSPRLDERIELPSAH